MPVGTVGTAYGEIESHVIEHPPTAASYYAVIDNSNAPTGSSASPQLAALGQQKQVTVVRHISSMQMFLRVRQQQIRVMLGRDMSTRPGDLLDQQPGTAEPGGDRHRD